MIEQWLEIGKKGENGLSSLAPTNTQAHKMKQFGKCFNLPV